MTFTYPPFYDVEQSVGNGDYPNRGTDVMLVQFLLFTIMYDSTWPLPAPLPGPDLPDTGSGLDAVYPIDGVVKEDLGAWIRAFQSFANAHGLGPVTVDGVVSHGGAAWGRVKPRATNWWTVHAMNHVLFLGDKSRFCNLPTDSSLPDDLKQALAFLTNIDPIP